VDSGEIPPDASFAMLARLEKPNEFAFVASLESFSSTIVPVFIIGGIKALIQFVITFLNYSSRKKKFYGKFYDGYTYGFFILIKIKFSIF